MMRHTHCFCTRQCIPQQFIYSYVSLSCFFPCHPLILPYVRAFGTGYEETKLVLYQLRKHFRFIASLLKCVMHVMKLQ
jgi:hypothetical protein